LCHNCSPVLIAGLLAGAYLLALPENAYVFTVAAIGSRSSLVATAITRYETHPRAWLNIEASPFPYTTGLLRKDQFLVGPNEVSYAHSSEYSIAWVYRRIVLGDCQRIRRIQFPLAGPESGGYIRFRYGKLQLWRLWRHRRLRGNRRRPRGMSVLQCPWSWLLSHRQ
jgi:hypothetical protein